MIKPILVNIFRFVFLVLLQVFFLPNLSIYHLAVPFLYVLFIILLPVDISSFMLFILSFLMGFTVDAFSNTLGLNTSACVFMAFCRISILKVMIPKGNEFLPEPSIKNFGFNWFLTYSAILVVLHHLFLFNVEYFRLSEFFATSMKAIISSVYTLILIILSQYLFGSRKVR